MLLDKKTEANKTEIYKAFDDLSGDWQKIEEFIEKVFDEGNDVDIDHFVGGAQKLSDSVDQLSKEVMSLSNDLK